MDGAVPVTACVTVVMPIGRITVYRIQPTLEGGVVARMSRPAVRHTETNATRRTVDAIFGSICGTVVRGMHESIRVHASLLLFIMAPLHARLRTSGDAFSTVAPGAVYSICVHTCSQVLPLVLQ